MTKIKTSLRRNIVKAGLSIATIAGLSTFGLVSIANADK